MGKIFCCLLLLSQALFSHVQLRDILVLTHEYDKNFIEGNTIPEETYGEMPLNHLGLSITRHAVEDGLYPFDEKPVRGIFVWPSGFWKIDNPIEFLDDLIQRVKGGVKLVIFGDFGLDVPEELKAAVDTRIHTLYGLLGVAPLGTFSHYNYGLSVVSMDPLMCGFERSYQGIRSTFERMSLLPQDHGVEVFCEVFDPKVQRSFPVVHINPYGARVANGFGFYIEMVQNRVLSQWLINPFRFFEQVFATRDLAKPDTTTKNGRRIYYSHVDGDGWYNKTYIPPYDESGMLSAEVLLKEIYQVYPDMPVTVGLIAAELDQDWVATREGIRIAKEISQFPHIAMGSHTYSHPFYWQFFEHYTPEKEEPFLSLYPEGHFEGYRSVDMDLHEENLPKGYRTPRAFANEPFSLDLEIGGSLDKIQDALGLKTPVTLYQWSGNTTPFAAAVRKVRERGIPNLNGGDSRFDFLYPSYAFVAPLGRLRGKERQIFSSNSNENTYTNLWTETYFGFKKLPETFENTERPLRIKPMNIYYHTYTGERLGALEALKDNLLYVRDRPIHAIHAAEYARIVEGFYEAEIETPRPGVTMIRNRRELETIRFDHALDQKVSFQESLGVIGQKRFQGSLYVFLDPGEFQPKIVLEKTTAIEPIPTAPVLYLYESSWEVSNWQESEDELTFVTYGYGQGVFELICPKPGIYRVYVGQEELAEVDVDERKLFFAIDKQGFEEIQVTIKKNFEES